jgi:hypothetical protein
LLDGRTGQPTSLALSGTVVASNAVTANALSTMLCVTDAGEGLQLVERTPDAEGLRVGTDGVIGRTSGFAALEHQSKTTLAPSPDWPTAYQLTVSLTLRQGADFSRLGRFRESTARRPYVAVWVETPSGKLVRVLAFWANKAKFYSELSAFWNIAGRDLDLLYSTARATREPGHYQLVWNGLDDALKPVPPGIYRIVVETNQEHGAYAKQAGTIVCGTAPSKVMLSAATNFEAVSVEYGLPTKPA